MKYIPTNKEGHREYRRAVHLYYNVPRKKELTIIRMKRRKAGLVRMDKRLWRKEAEPKIFYEL